MKNLFLLNFWINPRPGFFTPIFGKAFVGLIVAFFICGLIFHFLRKRDGKGLYVKVYESVGAFLLANSFIGVVILFLTYELVPFLSSRFWFLIWFAEISIWAYFILKELKKIPGRKKEIEEKKKYNKYIPR